MKIDTTTSEILLQSVYIKISTHYNSKKHGQMQDKSEKNENEYLCKILREIHLSLVDSW